MASTLSFHCFLLVVLVILVDRCHGKRTESRFIFKEIKVLVQHARQV